MQLTSLDDQRFYRDIVLGRVCCMAPGFTVNCFSYPEENSNGESQNVRWLVCLVSNFDCFTRELYTYMSTELPLFVA